MGNPQYKIFSPGEVKHVLSSPGEKYNMGGFLPGRNWTCGYVSCFPGGKSTPVPFLPGEICPCWFSPGENWGHVSVLPGRNADFDVSDRLARQANSNIVHNNAITI
jgi:hypothetical protein